MMPYRLTAMQIDFLRTFGGWIGSGVGAIVMCLAQLTPKEVEGWMSLGGFAVLTVCLIYALIRSEKKLEQKDTMIRDIFAKMDERNDKADQKLTAERLRLEAKWDAERRENMDERNKDRETREKFADAVEKLAAAVKSS